MNNWSFALIVGVVVLVFYLMASLNMAHNKACELENYSGSNWREDCMDNAERNEFDKQMAEEGFPD